MRERLGEREARWEARWEEKERGERERERAVLARERRLYAWEQDRVRWEQCSRGNEDHFQQVRYRAQVQRVKIKHGLKIDGSEFVGSGAVAVGWGSG
eukprot:2937332-Rhodomonas_salina.1